MASQADDTLDGGEGSDTYRVTGTQAGGWNVFNGFDNYADKGASGTDRIVAVGSGDVDIGLKNFSAASSGIESIDATGVAGTARLFGSYSADKLDFRGVSLLGSNFLIEGGGGNDTLVGSSATDKLFGGSGNDVLVGASGDRLDGGEGNDLLLNGTTLIGGNGQDRIALALHDDQKVVAYLGRVGGADGVADLVTVLGGQGALDFDATIRGFESGKDRIDLSQLLDGGNRTLNMDDLLISSLNGNSSIGFQSGVHAVGGGALDVTLTLEGVASVSASNFYFSNPALPWGTPALQEATVCL